MAGASSRTHPPRGRKRVGAETNTLKRARDGSAFTRCEACNKDVPVVLIDMHICSLDSKIRTSLEAQVVEKVAEANKPAERKRAASSDQKERKGKKGKKFKDPTAPKRPPTAFFLFMDDFRKSYKEAHPDSKSVSMVAKDGGEKWRSMSDEEKKPYVDKAAELKAEYEKEVAKLNEENEEEKKEEKEESEKEEE
ncbi:high mobility group B protein 7-like [Phoenix dactylifera]|uniref:High mobility group B protein 7-like n=1 Tax=Phoenix dactylifera TaxID=42345 RepID=A0A8B7CNA2_PHODC|nr:high mobility group B protein 7-like [Phoenix dactylifera]